MNTDRILVIQTAFLGDAILTLPMIQQIKSILPESIIDVLCIPGTKEIFEHSPSVKNVIVFDKRGRHKSLSSLLKLAGILRKNKYDKIYSPHRSIRTTLLVFLAHAKETFGFDKAAISFLYKHRIKYIDSIHEVERNKQLINSQLVSSDWKLLPEIKIPEKVEKTIEQLLSHYATDKIIAVAPGSVWATKVYPKEYFIEIIDQLIKKLYKIVLIGGPNDKALCREIESKFNDSVRSVAGDLTIIESIQLIKKCKLLISNDSAPTHMGMCANVPTLTIYVSTIPGFGFYPYQKKSNYVSYDELDCKPCGIHGFTECPIGSFECAWKLTPQMILKKIEQMLIA